MKLKIPKKKYQIVDGVRCNECILLDIRYGKRRLATGWTVRDSNPGGTEIFRTVQTLPGVHPVSCATGGGSFPVVNRPGIWR